MAVSTKLRGRQGLFFTLKIGSGTATSFADDVRSFELSSEDADDSGLTFAEAAAGLTKDWTLTVEAITSFDTGSLYKQLWDNPGATFSVVLGPFGNATPTATKPHYTFTALANGKPGISNEASTDTKAVATFEYEFSVQGDITAISA